MSAAPYRRDRYQLIEDGYQMAAACELCEGTKNLVIDHRIPLSQGGTNDLDNLRTLCASCNAKEAWRYRTKPDDHVRTKRGYALREDLVKACKLYAVEHDRLLYEVMEEALEQYLERQKEKADEEDTPHR